MPGHDIKIKFVRAGVSSVLFQGASSYRSASSASDTISISNKKILIQTKRSDDVTNVLSTHNGIMYKQIIKAICLYYVIEGKPNRIKEIRVERSRDGSLVKTIDAKGGVKQVVSKGTNLSPLLSVDKSKASILLTETKAGRAVLHASTHLIKSLDSTSQFDRFERLWRAFNALYKEYANKNTDHECHVFLRGDIENNPNKYPLSIAKASSLTAPEIRANVRWNQMILNNHSTQAKTKALHDSLLRNVDSRILGIYQTTLPVRQKYLAAEGLLLAVNSHIQSNIQAGSCRHSDVLSTLCLKYMYFVRNKIAHAEKSDHGFTILPGGPEEAEIRWLSPILEALVIDLINISDTF